MSAAERQESSPTLLPAERFVAMQRYSLREGLEAQFEKRWFVQDESLNSQNGFQWFGLLKRVPGTAPSSSSVSVVYNYADDDYEDDFNYLTLSFWSSPEVFSTSQAARSSQDTKAAVGADLATLVTNGLVTSSGPPKPASWSSMLWEGVDQPVSGAFVVMNRFTVKPGSEQEFEQRWARRESKLKEQAGFHFFHLMRREQTPDDDVNYISMSVWTNRAAFDKWWTSKNFANMAQVQGSLLEHPLTRYFYEGKLILNGNTK